MDTIDFNDTKARDNYFRFKDGRPSDHEIITDVQAMVEFVGPHALPDDPFLTNDICYSLRLVYPSMGVYIGQRVSRLAKAGHLPVLRLGNRGTRVIYGLVP